MSPALEYSSKENLAFMLDSAFRCRDTISIEAKGNYMYILDAEHKQLQTEKINYLQQHETKNSA